MPMGCPDQHRHIARMGQAADQIICVSQNAHCADCGRGQNACAIGFIVKRHVARHDGHIQRDTSRRNAFECADQLAHDLGLFRVAEV